MLRRAFVVSMLTLLFAGLFVFGTNVKGTSAASLSVPNGSFEEGVLCTVPDHWVMEAYDYTEAPPPISTYVHEVCENDTHYFSGERSCWLHSEVVDTDGTKRARYSHTYLESEDWINEPDATYVRFYVSGIQPTHSLYWGWNDEIWIGFNDSVVDGIVHFIFNNGETLNFNYYNDTKVGADGSLWYEYLYPIPANIDKTHFKIQIDCIAGDWTFYSTSYFADMSFYVDNVELLSSSPLSHDVAVIEVAPYRNWVYQGATTRVNVSVLNEGDYSEDADVTLFYNITANQKIGEASVHLDVAEEKTLTFIWDTHGVPYCHNYTITAVAEIQSDANNTNNMLDGTLRVKVRIVGDVNGDGQVDMQDIGVAGAAFGSTSEDPRWNLFADITGPVYLQPDGIVDMQDIALIARNFGSSC